MLFMLREFAGENVRIQVSTGETYLGTLVITDCDGEWLVALLFPDCPARYIVPAHIVSFALDKE